MWANAQCDGRHAEYSWRPLFNFNVKVGRREPSTVSSAVGLYGLGEKNEAGEQLEDFCLEHEMALANTMFKQHPRRLYTWTSPDGNTRNQIDYISIA